jgi:uncharacterized protein YabN with tetrapyrrole methylase and pyrophosphatase domain
MARGSLVVVGTGIKLAAHCTPEARQCIESAELVFTAGGDPVMEQWLTTINKSTISLHDFYGGTRSREETYEAATEAIVEAVRDGKRVCVAFYGHPGVFVNPSHEAIRRAREEGFAARMLPGISAEDCLFADLGLDPGELGCQSYEATDFLSNARKFDSTAMLILWQIAVVADHTFRVFDSDPNRLKILADSLIQHYGSEHLVAVYEAAALPVTQPRIQWVTLATLHTADVLQHSTLYVPPREVP